MAHLTDAVERERAWPGLTRLLLAGRDTALGYWRWFEAELGSVWYGRTAVPSATRHVLVIATSLPPRFDGGVFRPLSWMRYAAENGWRISAVTRSCAGAITDAGLQLATMIPAEAKVCYAPPLPLLPSRRLFVQVDGDFLTALALYRAGVRTMAAEPPAVVVATGPSFAAFIAGFLLARRFAARLVLDYRDEWSENPFAFVQTGRNDLWWERRCLNYASLVQFTTKGQLRHNDEAFPGLIARKGSVLLNGWEPDPRVVEGVADGRNDDRLVIAFSGVLGTMASPGRFLRDLARVLDRDPDLRDRIRLRFIGRRLPDAERELAEFPYREMIELIDQCPRSEADRLIRESDILLLMMNADMGRYLPGKLFEYLAAGKPILVHGPVGEAPDLVLHLGAGLHASDGAVDMLADVLATLAGSPAEAWNTVARKEWADRHTRQRMARSFFDRLSSMIASGTGLR
ncbi:MAG TPA: glycosyltransferase [Alphaproteobacteria bacterium]|nr:glycosyltransferase [Alphaproteobacteria bacterium]